MWMKLANGNYFVGVNLCVKLKEEDFCEKIEIREVFCSLIKNLYFSF
jgi:hypothetical protein